MRMSSTKIAINKKDRRFRPDFTLLQFDPYQHTKPVPDVVHSCDAAYYKTIFSKVSP